MNEILYILIAVLVVAAVGCPFVEAYRRAKEAEREDGDE
jgi:hypothetical protein